MRETDTNTNEVDIIAKVNKLPVPDRVHKTLGSRIPRKGLESEEGLSLKG